LKELKIDGDSIRNVLKDKFFNLIVLTSMNKESCPFFSFFCC